MVAVVDRLADIEVRDLAALLRELLAEILRPADVDARRPGGHAIEQPLARAGLAARPAVLFLRKGRAQLLEETLEAFEIRVRRAECGGHGFRLVASRGVRRRRRRVPTGRDVGLLH